MPFSNFLLRVLCLFAGWSPAEHTQKTLDSVCSMTVNCSRNELDLFRAHATEIYNAFKENRQIPTREVLGFQDFVRRHKISIFRSDSTPPLQEWNAGLFYDICLAIEASDLRKRAK